MKHYAEAACRVSARTTEEAFYLSEEKQLAILRAIEVVGEAAKHVPQEIRDLAPDVPWREIAGTRDKIAHHYFGVDLYRVWRVVTDDLPSLIVEVTALLKRFEAEGTD